MRRVRTVGRRLRLALCLAATGPLAGQTPTATPGAGFPQGETLTVHLLTAGPGDAVWEKFGHNAILIADTVAGWSMAYNYGVFDFAAPDFMLNFVRGRLLYQLAAWPGRATLAHYAEAGRDIWLQELNLSPAQRAELLAFLEWNYLPQNRFYLYDYYRDNCSTRVRDAIDRVTGGAIRRALGGEPSGATFRSDTRRLTAAAEAAYTGLQLTMGRPIDRPISEYERTFVPMVLRDAVRDVRIARPDGGLVPLVADEVFAFDAPRPPPPESPPDRTWAYLLGGLLIGGAFVLLGRRRHASAAARRAFAVSAGVWLFVVGLLGTIIACLWAFTDHWPTYANENLLQVHPLAFVLAVVVPVAVLHGGAGGRAGAGEPSGGTGASGFRGRLRRIGLLGVWGAVGLSVLGFLLQALPAWDQVNGEIIALMLPAWLGLAWGVAGLRRRDDTDTLPFRSHNPLSSR
ncbi:MAG: DUF4105 domain-containing protein [Longimicrobiales bacterium]